jgi:hypothetical protein
MASHAQVPTPLLRGDTIRVYFASRPRPDLSLTGFVDLDAADPTRVLKIAPQPILDLGKPGTFDEHGIMPSCAIADGDIVYLYYSGWQRGVTVPYTNSTGLAISEDGGETFRKVSNGPILGKSICDPYSATSPGVLRGEHGWQMWYCSGREWLRINDKYEHTYDIKFAKSQDGVRWEPTGEVVVKQRTPDEAITRPWTIPTSDGYCMWFCFRGSRDFRDGAEAYRIGCAHSFDSHTWTRCQASGGIAASEHGWDSRTVAYPAVVRADSRLLMFYNGNGFGTQGFGVAVLDEVP